MTTRWHAHTFHQVQFCHSGTITVEGEGANYTLKEGQAALIPARWAHRAVISKARSISVFYEPTRFLDFPNGIYRINGSAVLTQMMLMSAQWSIDRDVANIASDRFLEGLAYVLRYSIAQEASEPGQMDPIVACAIEFTETNFRDATLARVAAASGVSERTLRRRFYAVTAVTWQEFRVHCQIRKAMFCLHATDRTLSSIAHEIGFSSSSAFTRAFNRVTNMSPTEFRRRAEGRA
jgi:AraC-like DNA-binding protein